MKNIKKYTLLLLCLFVMTIIFSHEAEANVFGTLRGKTVTFAVQLRALAYGFACFGVIMFTFLAISGKINFKHLGYIFISCFMLAAVGGIIDYFTGGNAHLSGGGAFRPDYLYAAPSSSLG